MDCEWTTGLGWTGAVYFGISAKEVLAALRIHSVPRAKWADVKRRIRIMVRAAQKILNAEKPKK